MAFVALLQNLASVDCPVVYSGLQINSSFAFFEKISVAVDWVNIKVCLIPHLKGLTATFALM